MTSAITDDTAELISQLAVAVHDFRQGAEAYRLAAAPDNSSRAEANANAQTHSPAWVAVICVVAALVWGLGKDGDKAESLVALQAQIGRQQVDIDRMQDYLNAIYMQAPHLKPPENQERKNSP